MTRAVVFLVAAIIGVLVWLLASPLVIDERVNEEFPMAAMAEVPGNMTRAEVGQAMAAMAKVESEASEPMPESSSDPVRLASGTFRDADSFHKGSGTATVYRLADGSAVLRFEEFRVTNGPDLRVLVSQHPDPASHDDLESAGYVELGKLKGNIGNQNYAIPSGVDVDAQRSVVIYCKPFRVVFSVAPLAAP